MKKEFNKFNRNSKKKNVSKIGNTSFWVLFVKACRDFGDVINYC